MRVRVGGGIPPAQRPFLLPATRTPKRRQRACDLLRNAIRNADIDGLIACQQRRGFNFPTMERPATNLS